MSDNKELTLEQMMDDLENCVRELESDDISLEDSFHIYENGRRIKILPKKSYFCPKLITP